ncbi:MAG: hypothetical protein ABSD64_08430 [Terriglobales bacterium]|jgi:hypothetical protein
MAASLPFFHKPGKKPQHESHGTRAQQSENQFHSDPPGAIANHAPQHLFDDRERKGWLNGA